MAARKKATARKTAPARKSAPKGKDAIALLRADHALVQGLFDQFEKARGNDRKKALAEKICQELRVHTRIEEEILYPAAREALRDEDLLDEAEVEHAGAKDLIAQIESSSPGADLYDAKVTVLGEYIKHHVKEEHEEMFPKLKKIEARPEGDRRAPRSAEGASSRRAAPAARPRERAHRQQARRQVGREAPERRLHCGPRPRSWPEELASGAPLA